MRSVPLLLVLTACEPYFPLSKPPNGSGGGGGGGFGGGGGGGGCPYLYSSDACPPPWHDAAVDAIDAIPPDAVPDAAPRSFIEAEWIANPQNWQLEDGTGDHGGE